MKKDDLIEIVIEDLGVDGEGIGKTDGITFFVKDTVIGDRVEAKIMKMKKTYGYARLMRILEPSPARVEPRCAYARQCGGCQLQAMSYEAQLAYKVNKVWNHLTRIGGLTGLPKPEIMGMEDPWRYRNKAQFPFGTDKDGHAVTGFYAARSHRIVPCTECWLGVEENRPILEKILNHMEKRRIPAYEEESGKGLVRHVLIRKGFSTGEIMVCLVLNGRTLPGLSALTESLKQVEGMTSISINVNQKNTNVIMGSEMIPVWGKDYITDRIGEISYQISALSFFQVNPVQTRKLYETALEYADLKGEETVWDLYCGIGTISLFLAQKAGRVYGVEIVPEAIEDARRNAALNGFFNVEFYVGKAEEVLPEKYRSEGIRADVIVVDPPRKGCDAACLETMVKMQPERIVYVSCDSATLARDLKYLCSEGYEVKKVKACDMFPGTVHVETVVSLSKGEIDSKKVRVELSLEDMDMSGFQKGATYEQIKAYVLEHTGLKVSSLYISQIKRKCGLDVGQNYNLSKKEDAKVPQCPPEKEAAITEALKFFGMI